ncbi:MAG: 1-acyl-sn-glycerol-3-phosphate acyltransferase [Flavobacteriales bacterium]|nr:1-acyl-sn-glycerol-3-phosphate acyltransferase [Flavobacteriales bacterium]
MTFRKEPFSLLYFLFRPFIWTALRLFYRQITIIGKENFPRSGPVILIANHQNALMDPLLLCCFLPRQLHWLSRADVFRKPLIGFFLRMINMLPIFRKRDNVDIQSENRKIFSECLRKFKSDSVIALFPEGTHHAGRVLHPFKKGMARLAMEAAGNMDLQIVCIGIDYSDYYSGQSSVILNIGKSFSLKSLELNGHLPSVKELSDTSFKKLATLMIHLPDENLQHAVVSLRYAIAFDHWKNKWKEFNWRDEFLLIQKFIRSLESNPELKRKFIALGNEYQELIPLIARTENAEYNRMRAATEKQFPLLILLPLLGLLNGVVHFPPSRICHALKHSLTSDKQFHSSIMLLAGMVLYPVYWIVLFFLLAWISNAVVACCILGFFILMLRIWNIKRFRIYADEDEYALKKKVEEAFPLALRFKWMNEKLVAIVKEVSVRVG